MTPAERALREAGLLYGHHDTQLTLGESPAPPATGLTRVGDILPAVVDNLTARAGRDPDDFCEGCGAEHDVKVGRHLCNACQKRTRSERLHRSLGEFYQQIDGRRGRRS